MICLLTYQKRYLVNCKYAHIKLVINKYEYRINESRKCMHP